MTLYRIENITLKPVILIARNHDDAVSMFANGLVTGLGHRPDADFEVVKWRPRRDAPDTPPLRWIQRGYRGIIWPVDDNQGWEMLCAEP